MLVFISMSLSGQFFEALYDVPVLLDLEEITEEAVMFDKPSGRIAQVSARTYLSQAKILNAYKATLPELGWKQTSESKYVREKEILSISVVKSNASNEKITVVIFSLGPIKQ